MPKDVIGKPMDGVINGYDTTGYEWDVYQKTPIMPTYTIALAVLFNYTHAGKVMTSKNISAWISDGKNSLEQVNTNVDYTETFLLFLEEYFNMTDPLPKLDRLDAPFGWPAAMENWGLFIYFNRYLSHESTIAHELGHLWFGNLVTCKNFTQ